MTDVAFVIEPDDTLMAVMPGDAATVGNVDHCTCYGHVGQHAAADISYVTEDCVQAHPSDYVYLLDELLQSGYEICVILIDRIGDDDYRRARHVQLGL